MIAKRLLIAVMATSALISLPVHAQEAADPAKPPAAASTTPPAVKKAAVPPPPAAQPDATKLPPNERIAKRKQWQQKWKSMTTEQKKAHKDARHKGMTEARMKALENYQKRLAPEQKAYIKQSLDSRNGSRKEVLDRLKAAQAKEKEAAAKVPAKTPTATDNAVPAKPE